VKISRTYTPGRAVGLVGEVAFAGDSVGHRHEHGCDRVDGLCCVIVSREFAILDLGRDAAEVLVRAGGEVAGSYV